MLFKSTIEINRFAPIAHTTSFDNLSPLIRNVEEDALVPIIGQELYDAIRAELQNEDALSDKKKELLLRCRCVVAPLVAYNFTPLTEVKLSDAGAQRTATQNFQTAYQNQVANFREQCLTDHQKAIERLYNFLEKNIETFTQWAGSDEFTVYRSLFIKTGGEFDKNIQTASPYTNYYAVRSFMVDVENNVIKKLLGAELFAALKETDADPDGTFTASEKELLQYVKKAAAFLTITTAIPFLDVRLDSNGFTVMNTAFAQNDAQTKRSAAEADRMNNYIAACRSLATTYVNNISSWLKENVAQKEEAIQVPETGNLERKGSFGFF